MNVTKTALAIILTTSAVFAANTAEASTRDHLDRVALKIQRLAGELYNEIPAHYRHTSSYTHMRRDAAKLYHLAAHTHSVAHYGSIYHLENDLRQMDHYFHHLEGLIKHVDHAASFGIGGHKHGNTAHVFALLHELEDEIHHLRDDVEALTGHHTYYTPVVPVAPVIIHHGGHHGHHDAHHRHGHRRHRGGSISFGGNGWRVRLGH